MIDLRKRHVPSGASPLGASPAGTNPGYAFSASPTALTSENVTSRTVGPHHPAARQATDTKESHLHASAGRDVTSMQVKRQFVRLPQWYWTLATSPAPAHTLVLTSLWTWINKGSRTRRTFLWLILAWQLAVAFELVFAPGAIASTAVSGVEWTRLTDTDGVPLSSYMFVTDHGSLLNPGNKPLQMLLSAEAGCFIAVVALGLWAVGWALSFDWLNVIAPAFEKVSNALSFFQSKPVLIFFMTLGAASIAWHWLVNQHSKAMSKLIVTAMVILGGTLALSHTVTYLASQDGPLSMGRDVGLQVAKQIDPNLSGGSGSAQVHTLQATLADAVARRPLQIWNFGYNIDGEGGSCKAAWSQYTKAGDEDNLKDAIKDCGAAHSEQIKDTVDNPSGGQVGTGVLVIVLACIVLWFLGLAAFKVVVAAAQALFYCVIAPPAFAFAFMLGGSVSFAARCAADAIVSALAMGGYVIFLAGSMVMISAMLSNPGEWGGGLGSLTILCIIMVALVHLLKRFSTHLEMDSRRLSGLFANGPSFMGGGGKNAQLMHALGIQHGSPLVDPASPFMDLSQRAGTVASTGASRGVGMLRSWQANSGGPSWGGQRPGIQRYPGESPETSADASTTAPTETAPARHMPATPDGAAAAADGTRTGALAAGVEASTSAERAKAAQAAAAVIFPEGELAETAAQAAAAAVHHHHAAPKQHSGTGDTQQQVSEQLNPYLAANPYDDSYIADSPMAAAPPPAAAAPAPTTAPANPFTSPNVTSSPMREAPDRGPVMIQNPWSRPIDPRDFEWAPYTDDDMTNPEPPAPPASLPR